jgi:uncharacterized protein YndB with AHSA1/START domain
MVGADTTSEPKVMSEKPTAQMLGLRWVLAATPERIFAALTDPVPLAKWWGPHGFTLAECKLDLVRGGAYRFTMQPPEGEAFHLSGELLEIAPPSRLVYTFRWDEPTPDDRETTVTLSLNAIGDATEVSLSQGEFATEERVALHRSGWTDSFEKLRALVERG